MIVVLLLTIVLAVAMSFASALRSLLRAGDRPERALERSALQLPGNLRSAGVAPTSGHGVGSGPPALSDPPPVDRDGLEEKIVSIHAVENVSVVGTGSTDVS